MKLHKVTVRVKPAAHHPQFWDIQFDYLIVWLFAAKAEVAANAAVNVASAMPYEIVGTKAEVEDADPADRPEFEERVAVAKRDGLSWFLVACRTGADEGDFATKLGDDPE